LHISSVRVSCGCVSASALKTTLAPGEETAIQARMDTTRFTGVKTVTIYVQFDRPSFEEVRLWVQANGRNDFAVTPDTLAFGQVKRSAGASTSVTVNFYGSVDTKVLEARTESNYIQASVKEAKREGSEVSYQVTAKLRADTPAGRWYTDVWLKTNNPSLPQLRVPLTVEIESALSISPESVRLGDVAANAESEQRVIVRGARPFKIKSVLGGGDDLVVRDSSPESKPVHVLTVKIKGGKPGEVNKTLRVVTDLPEEGEIEFPVSARVMP
jgi:hypothetical protein